MANEPEQQNCPHCGRLTPLGGSQQENVLGGAIACRHCDRSFAASGSPLSTASPHRAKPADDRLSPARGLEGLLHPGAPTDVGLPTSAVAAAGLTGLFYVVLGGFFGQSYLGELFAERGWVPYLITWLASWAGVVLAAKWRLLTRQRRALALDLLPETIASTISPDNAHIFSSYVRHLAEVSPDNFLCRRVLGAMQHLRARRGVQETVDQLDRQAVIDANAVESSYAMVRVFIWSIPILGFIGTVLGIGTAVGAFSNSVAAAVDLEVMRQSIGAVTVGLGVAFDTTLLALVMSILIMFPASSLQKAEEDLLVGVDRYCERRLVQRLEESPREATASAASLGAELSRLAGALSALERHLAHSEGS